MSELRPIVFELLTLDEAAVRCRVTAETFRRKYTGRIVRKLGDPRVSTHDLADWLDSGEHVTADSWEGVGDGASPLSKRSRDQAA